MKINSISKDFDNKILLWPKDLKTVRETQDQNIIHSVDDSFEKIFTVQSVLQAILNGKLLERHTKKDNKVFYIIDYKYLTEVK